MGAGRGEGRRIPGGGARSGPVLSLGCSRGARGQWGGQAGDGAGGHRGAEPCERTSHVLLRTQRPNPFGTIRKSFVEEELLELGLEA